MQNQKKDMTDHRYFPQANIPVSWNLFHKVLSQSESILLLAGIKNIRTKSLGSNNKQNVVLATINGLSQIKTPEEVAKLRGKSVEEILG